MFIIDLQSIIDRDSWRIQEILWRVRYLSNFYRDRPPGHRPLEAARRARMEPGGAAGLAPCIQENAFAGAARQGSPEAQSNELGDFVEWRRGWDSNPRYAFDVYSLSRGAPSTTRPPLRCGLIMCLNRRLQGFFAILHILPYRARYFSRVCRQGLAPRPGRFSNRHTFLCLILPGRAKIDADRNVSSRP